MATVKKSKKKIIVPICVILVIAIVAGAIFGVVKSKSGTEVSLNTISTGDIIEDVSLTGTVSAGTTKEYKVSAVATVKQVYVKVGDKVKKDDLLATFDVDSLNNQINTLRSSYNEALSSYNSAVKTQNEAKRKVNEINSEIKSKEKEISKLEKQVVTTKKHTTAKRTTAKPATTKATTKATTTTTTTTATTTTTTTATSSSTATVSDLVEQLTQLNKTLTQITTDLNTLTTMMQIITDTITDAIANGNFDSAVIADKVAAAVAQAVKDGIIDAAQFVVDSDVAIDMIQKAVENIDFEAIAGTVVNSKNVSLTSAQLQLASLEAQKAVFKAQADGTLVSAQKKTLDLSKQTLDTLEEQKKEMEEGWKAAFDGTITAVDITAGGKTTALSSGITLENLNQMAVKVSLGEYDVHKVKVGMAATVTTAYGTYDAEVASIAPTATGGSESSILDNVGSMAGISGLSSLTASGAGVECVITIPQTDENIIAGFDADVTIKTGEYLGVTVVPIESIKLEKTGSYVYLYNEDDKTVTKTQIETGAVSDTAYEVKSGLKPGDKIVAAPEATYEEDTFKVKVVDKKTK